MEMSDGYIPEAPSKEKKKEEETAPVAELAPQQSSGIDYAAELERVRSVKDYFQKHGNSEYMSREVKIAAHQGYMQALAMELELVDRLEGQRPQKRRRMPFPGQTLKPQG